MKFLKLFEMFDKKYILLKDIIPDDEQNRRKPFFYPKGTIFKITPNGYYVPVAINLAAQGRKGLGLAGWIYKNYKNSEILPLILIKGIDYDEV